jgi:hypothetical protein
MVAQPTGTESKNTDDNRLLTAVMITANSEETLGILKVFFFVHNILKRLARAVDD